VATKYYPQNSNTVSCDYPVGSPHDLATTAGTPTTHTDDTSGISAWTTIRTYQLNVGTGLMSSGDTLNFSLSINTISNTDVRVWAFYVDGSCSSVGLTGYSATFTTATTHTGSLTMSSISPGGTHICLVVDAQRNLSHGTRSVTLDIQSSSTWIEAPWGGTPAAVKTPAVL